MTADRTQTMTANNAAEADHEGEQSGETRGRGHAYALDRGLLEDRIDVAEQQAAIAGGPQEGDR
jgi:hypothetical protein